MSSEDTPREKATVVVPCPVCGEPGKVTGEDEAGALEVDFSSHKHDEVAPSTAPDVPTAEQALADSPPSEKGTNVKKEGSK